MGPASATEVRNEADPGGTAEPRGTIISIVFEGNERTKEAVLRRAVDPEPGTRYDETVAKEIENDLKRLGLFSDIEVVPHDLPDGVEVVVTVEERWTLVPIPFFQTTSSGVSGGLFVFESNLFGYNKQLIAGGSYGSEGFAGLLIYNDTAVLGSDWLFSSSFNVGRSTVETADPAYEDPWRFTGDSLSTGGSIGYRLSEAVSVRAGVDYEYWELLESDLPETVAESGGYGFLTYSVAGRLDQTEPQEFFNSGYRVGARVDSTPRESGWGVSGEAHANALVFDAHRFGLATRAAYGDRPVLLKPRLGGGPTQRTLTPGTIADDTFVSQGTSYEAPVLRFSWATITALGFYEGGYIGEPDEVYHGGGGGMRLYLSRVTFPAVGFDVAWNVSNNYPVFRFSLGGRI